MVKAFDYVKGDHMELKDFISETLVEISTGVLEAAEKLQGDKKTEKVWINPPMLPAGTKGFTETPQHIGVLGRLSEKAQIAVLAVDFNLAITAVDEEKGKISVLSAIIGFGGSSEASTENKSISSVKFTIPIALPLSIRPI